MGHVLWVAVCLLLPFTPRWSLAQESSGSSEQKLFTLGARFDTVPTSDLRMSEGLAGSAQPSLVGGSLQSSRMGAALTYRPTPSVFVTLHGGAVLSPQLTVTGSSTAAGDISSVWTPESAPYLGFEVGANVLPKSAFRFTPRARWNRASMGGTRLTLSNSVGTCTYDYSTNNTSTCLTIGQNTGGGVTRYSWVWNQFDLGLELALDIGPDQAPFLTVGLEGVQTFSIVSGDLTYTAPLAGTSNTEKMTFTNTKTDLLALNLSSTLGMVRLGVSLRFLGDFGVFSHVGILF